ncbi:MAG: histidine kinase [Acidobacteriota bacterium]|nr:histidine kinase [Acidobacteriota bacterium]
MWQVEDGLPQNQIESVLQTRDGYLWLAGNEGLARFDGVRFVVFNRENTAALKNNVFVTLFEDRDGALWVGTEDGLLKYKDERFVLYTTDNGLVGNFVRVIVDSADGGLWIGTMDGVSHFKDGTFTNYTKANGLTDDEVWAMCRDHEGNLWIGTNHGGLNKFKDGKFTAYTVSDGLAGNNLRAVYADREGYLWLGTNNHGLSRFKDGTFTTYTTKDGLSHNSVKAIHQDHEGNLWVGTIGGLNRYRDGVFAAYPAREGLSVAHVLSIYEDREQNLWLGTGDSGLHRLKDFNIRTYTERDGLSGHIVRSISEHRGGGVWLGTWMGSGLSLLRGETFTTYSKRDGLANDSVRTLFEDRAGDLWIGTANAGLVKYRDSVFTTYTGRANWPSMELFALHEDSTGALWLGGQKGLVRYKDNVFTVYSTADGLISNWVRAICEGHDGSIWVGTEEGGLARYRDGEFINYTTAQGLSQNIVYALYQDADGALWIGTASGGLNRFKDGRFTTYTTKDGLYANGIHQILEDGKGNLWLGSSKGIFRVSKKELNEFAERGRGSVMSVAYGKADITTATVAFSGAQPAACKTEDGRLWFATHKGVVVIDADRIKLNEQVPPVVVESILVNQQPIDLKDIIQVPPGRGNVEIHYTALSFVAPEKVRFKYQLNGFDADWIDADTRRVAYYTNLPPGRYHFKVIAANNDGLWNERGASFDFHQQPHFYETAWFYALLAGLTALMIWQLHHSRVTRMKRQHAAVLDERSRIAREIHDTLAQGFAGISIQLEAIKHMLKVAPDRVPEHLELTRELVRSGLTEARRSIRGLRSQTLEGSDLAAALASIPKQLRASTPVQIEVRGTPRRLPQTVENNLLRIAQECFTNAVKHAHAERIRIELSFDSRYVRLRVQDDGCGFDAQTLPSSADEHFGLLGMRERVEQLGGQFVLRTAPGAGTEISATIPG